MHCPVPRSKKVNRMHSKVSSNSLLSFFPNDRTEHRSGESKDLQGKTRSGESEDLQEKTRGGESEEPRGKTPFGENRLSPPSGRLQTKGNIFLIGFMGAGKSTIADYMHRTYGMDVVEMDQVIEQREGMCISDLFKERGEEYFRNLETELLRDLQDQTNAVVSCGGGVPMREVNVREMKKSGFVVLLTALPGTILERVRDSHDRPLLENNKNVAFISSLMEKRREKYEAAADLVIRTDGRTAAEICGEILQKLFAVP